MKTINFGPKILWRVLAAVFGIMLAVSVGGNVVTQHNASYLNQLLGVSNTKVVTEDVTDEEIEASYRYKTEYDSWQDVRDRGIALTEQMAAEGTVLMYNKDDALPLGKSVKISVFGHSAKSQAISESGNGQASRIIDLKKALVTEFGESNINGTLWDYYDKQSNPRRTAGTLPTEPVDFITNSSVTGSYAQYGDVAIYIISRVGGEGNDLIKVPASESVESSRYLALSDTEKQVLQHIKDSSFSKRIVLVNTYNALELGWLEEYNIDACLYVGSPGESGFKAVAEILSGTVNPSGKLVDTYAYHSFSAPAMMNFGALNFSNSSDLDNISTLQNYVMYKEGIYVGYKYYETRYEDAVLGQGNATSNVGVWTGGSSWNYADEVQFPFGYGLSYTTYKQTLDSVDVDWNGKTATVKVTVENKGNKAGKDVVEVYAQAPYTAGGVEKASVQLVGFAKTGVIEPGHSESVTVEVELRDLASYDYKEYKTYILDKGDYYFAIGNGSHDALNNILAAKGKTTSNGMDYNGDAKKAHKATKSGFNRQEYRYSATNYAITNQFDNADINNYDGKSITYLSRSNWKDTYPTTEADYTATKKMVDELWSYTTPETKSAGDPDKPPAAYTKGDSDTSSIKMGEDPAYNLATIIGADYNDPAWEAILDALTMEDYIQATKQGRVAIEQIGLRATTAIDSPGIWRNTKYREDWKDDNSKETDEKTVLYPGEPIIAGTWNVELLYEMGDSIGEEALWCGETGWYGPGANTHRTPYSGRNYEYYSEDGFLAGKLCEQCVHGAMNKGVICYLKHFFLNDQETNRIGVSTFSNEQALREIYLRAFQYAFETTGEDDPACNGIMGAFNRIGLVWTGHHKNLWKNVMEGEWGFWGAITTDFGQNPQYLMEPRIAYEAGTTMFCTSMATFPTYLTPIIEAKDDLKLLENWREAIHRNLYVLAHSKAMNGVTSSSKIVKIMTWYEKAFVALITISSVVFAASMLIVVYQSFIYKKED